MGPVSISTKRRKRITGQGEPGDSYGQDRTVTRVISRSSWMQTATRRIRGARCEEREKQGKEGHVMQQIDECIRK